MITKYQIRALVACRRYRSKYPHTMYVTVCEEDGIPQYPPYTDGCGGCSLMDPCPACVAFVKNEVFRSFPLSNGETVEIIPFL